MLPTSVRRPRLKWNKMRIAVALMLWALSTAMNGEAADISPAPVRRPGKAPAIKQPVLFNTLEADAVVAALQVYPPDNPWNQAVDRWPVHANSRNIIATIGAGKPLRGNYDMAYILVPPEQAKVDVKITEYPQESDPGPYPLPDNLPIEGWPTCSREDPRMAGQTLDDIQCDKVNAGGDRHAIILDPSNRILYEFWQMKKTAQGWQASQASIFDLKSNRLRPDGWTSSGCRRAADFSRDCSLRRDPQRDGSARHAGYGSANATRATLRRRRTLPVATTTRISRGWANASA